MPSDSRNTQVIYFPFFHCANTSTDVTGYIFSDVPGVIRCLISFPIIQPHPGDPAVADQTLACVQLANPAALPHGSPLLSHSHCEAFSVASLVLQMALLLLTP